jgi:hypothetical protein
VSSPQAELEAFVRRRLKRWDHRDLALEDAGATLIRELAASIAPPGDEAAWRRRPSISDDGTPIVLSWKIGRGHGNALRLLVEPGNLGMNVAQQIAFALARLDSLLGLLTWRCAAADINAVTTKVFPSDPAATRGWLGGIWLGANVLPSSSGSSDDADLRLYLNLRHGDAPSRWRRLAILISSFVSSSHEAFFDNWLATVSPRAIPVGLGVVVAAGRVGAIRPYVCVYDPTLASLSALSSPVSTVAPQALKEAHESFADWFGPVRPQTVTVGYDFVRDTTGAFLPTVSRVKVDICCHLVTPDQALQLPSWIAQLLAAWSLESWSLAQFLEDVGAVWGGSGIRYLSLGFAPALDHVTVYAKPRT